MSKNLIILLIVLVVSAAGLGALAIISPEMFKNGFSRLAPAKKVTTTNSTVTNAAVNTNRTYTLAKETKGNVNVSLDAKLPAVTIHLSSYEKMSTWQGQKPEAGKSFIIVYSDPVPTNKISAVVSDLKKGVVLVSSAGRTSYLRMKVAADTITNDHGYFAFQVPSNATNFSVVIGSGSTAVSLALPPAK